MSVELDDQDRAAFLRNLLKEVATGRLGPDEADERASEAGFGFLSNIIALDDYWPSAKPFWTVPMVLAWISWRTYSEVREWDRDYLFRRRDWGRVGEGTTNPDMRGQFKLYRREAPNSDQFAQWGNKRFGPWARMKDGRPAVLQNCPAEHSVGALMQELKNGKLLGYAMPRVGPSRVEVPLSELADIELIVGSAGEDGFCFRRRPNVLVYRDVLFSRLAVLDVWPEHAKSDHDERGDFWISPMVDDLEAREDLYIEITADALVVADGPPVRGRTSTKPTKEQLEELCIKIQEDLNEGKPPLTGSQMVEWGIKNGISPFGIRKLRKKLPAHLKNKRGRPPS